MKFGLTLALLSFLFLFTGTGEAATQGKKIEETVITVLGNCGMCKDRIERAAYSVKGVRRATWDQEAQKLTLTYRSDRTDLATIERAVAKAGHDTENFLADDETHANLHHCCIYERDPELLKKN
ncbi:MAG: heavy-metal-associated domain-containing protein, partial [Bacteroidota bacterium]